MGNRDYTGDKDFLENREFRAETIEINLYRGKLLAIIIILLELVMVVIDIITNLLNVDDRFRFTSYLIMYVAMILANTIFLLWANSVKDVPEKPVRQLKKIEVSIVVFITFFMAWGSVLTLMDQKLYGGLAPFMINLLTSSIIYNFNRKYILIPFILSSGIMLVGLPFFQSSSDVLIGHYFNLSICIVIAWVASRIVFQSHYKQYVNKQQLNKSKELLEAETRINVRNNRKLKEINMQLKRLSMFDELTKLPNRRSFRDYIDYHFDYLRDKLVRFSIIMIDVDRFKQLNDNYGHASGDIVLKRIANQISSCINVETDFVARWGGDEFIYASFNKSPEDIAKIADNLQAKILSLNARSESTLKTPDISISLGTCTLNFTGKETIHRCIENADKALYAAKTGGRNCVRNF